MMRLSIFQTSLLQIFKGQSRIFHDGLKRADLELSVKRYCGFLETDWKLRRIQADVAASGSHVLVSLELEDFDYLCT